MIEELHSHADVKAVVRDEVRDFGLCLGHHLEGMSEKSLESIQAVDKDLLFEREPSFVAEVSGFLIGSKDFDRVASWIARGFTEEGERLVFSTNTRSRILALVPLVKKCLINSEIECLPQFLMDRDEDDIDPLSLPNILAYRIISRFERLKNFAVGRDIGSADIQTIDLPVLED